MIRRPDSGRAGAGTGAQRDPGGNILRENMWSLM